MVHRHQALCLPFSIAWSIATLPCLPFTTLPYKTTLYLHRQLLHFIKLITTLKFPFHAMFLLIDNL
uniref:Uncharacterized protein n=1 Tax=Arundo donax TaxID=35708 RepID=A0A0A8YA11_ARUDO